MFNHSLQHSTLANHPLVLNIRKIKIEKTEEEQSKNQITKLAIGMPGGADFEDKWENLPKVYCNVCKADIDYVSIVNISL